MPTGHSAQTISDALHTATTMLSRVSSSPRLDAELLLEYVTGLPRVSFRAAPERELPVAAGWSFQQLVKRRMQGEPVAYIRQQQEFWSLLLEVGADVLIPRPQTELVVERALVHLPREAAARVLDLGTGSGAIALAIASERPHAQVCATDVSDRALDIARRNAARLDAHNVTFAQSNWFESLTGQQFDVIVSNPPYVADSDPELAHDVKKHEPALALFAGRTGLDAIETIARDSAAHLRPKGRLILEHGWQQGRAVRDLLACNGFMHIATHRDLEGRERVTEAVVAPSEAM